ncbi:MAG: AzlD domain-containing protein [Clostridia bacterium]|nr:AzlD domain-containing protein [Oscillospiraceae bacterium]MBQ7033096.1 AzlD domain-containing protein [Clostridia bacterium]
MPDFRFFIYLAVTAGVTYLIRMIPLVLVRRKIRNRFLLSFLYYIPYAVLSVMTVPAIFYATESLWSAATGFLAAAVAAYFEKSLLFVAASACGAVFLVEMLIPLLG